MTNDEIRQKAIEFVENMEYECERLLCGKNCPRLKDCTKNIAPIQYNPVKIFAYEQGFADGVVEGRNEVITELLETPKYDELSQKIALDILERGVEKGKKITRADLAERDKRVRNKTMDPFEREMANINRVEWTEQNLAIFAMNISEIIEQMKGEDNHNENS